MKSISGISRPPNYDFIWYVCFVCTVRIATAHVESHFSHVTKKMGQIQTGILDHKRLLDMLVLKLTGRIGPNAATSPIARKLDGHKFLKTDLPW